MKTKYSIVREYIEKNIMDQTYKPNQKIDSESELMKRFGISRHTVRMAIGDLVTEGWLYRVQGAGTFCTDQTKIGSRNKKEIKKVALITAYISDYIFSSVIRGAEARLSEQGYQVIIFSTNNSYEKEKDILETILIQKFDGIIVEPTKSAYSNPNISYYLELERMGIPYIMIHGYYDALEPVHIIVNDEKGGFLQAEHLIENGHTNIVGIFKAEDMQGAKRLKGFLQAHRQYKVEVNPANIITFETEQEIKPAAELEKLLDNDSSITAVVCYNDELAMDILEMLRKRNVQIPQDLSIIGFDNSFLASISEVKLTSISHPKSCLGEAAASKIMDLIQHVKQHKNDKTHQVESIQYEPKLEKRDSVQVLTTSPKK